MIAQTANELPVDASPSEVPEVSAPPREMPSLFPLPPSHPIYDRVESRAESLVPAQLIAPLFGPSEDGVSADRSKTKEQQTKEFSKPSTVITVELQSDFVWFSQTDASRAAVGAIPDGAFFRRARLGAFGELYDTFEYRVEFDFANAARPIFLDNWIAMTKIPVIKNIIVGHFFEPFSLERYTPNRFITFTERSLADTFAPARNLGAMIYGNMLEERLTWAAGIFRSNSNAFGEDVSFKPGWASTFHLTGLPYFKEVDAFERYLLHLGVSYSYRLPGDDAVRFSTQPSVRLRQEGVGGVPRFVDTGDLDASRFQLLGFESALVTGPFSLQAEWIQAPVDQRDGTNLNFHSGYVYASWFLTGESRSYSPTSILGRFREGIFQRVVPKTFVFAPDGKGTKRGPGAWEVAARWGYINLNSGPVNGGYMQDVTLGVNWYLNPYAKVQFNAVRTFLDDRRSGSSYTDSFALRFQWEH